MITKKVKCLHCGTVVECHGDSCMLTCNCQKVRVVGGIITEGSLGVDYIDASNKLLLG